MTSSPGKFEAWREDVELFLGETEFSSGSCCSELADSAVCTHRSSSGSAVNSPGQSWRKGYSDGPAEGNSSPSHPLVPPLKMNGKSVRGLSNRTLNKIRASQGDSANTTPRSLISTLPDAPLSISVSGRRSQGPTSRSSSPAPSVCSAGSGSSFGSQSSEFLSFGDSQESERSRRLSSRDRQEHRALSCLSPRLPPVSVSAVQQHLVLEAHSQQEQRRQATNATQFSFFDYGNLLSLVDQTPALEAPRVGRMASSLPVCGDNSPQTEENTVHSDGLDSSDEEMSSRSSRKHHYFEQKPGILELSSNSAEYATSTNADAKRDFSERKELISSTSTLFDMLQRSAANSVLNSARREPSEPVNPHDSPIGLTPRKDSDSNSEKNFANLPLSKIDVPAETLLLRAVIVGDHSAGKSTLLRSIASSKYPHLALSESLAVTGKSSAAPRNPLSSRSVSPVLVDKALDNVEQNGDVKLCFPTAPLAVKPVMRLAKKVSMSDVTQVFAVSCSVSSSSRDVDDDDMIFSIGASRDTLCVSRSFSDSRSPSPSLFGDFSSHTPKSTSRNAMMLLESSSSKYLTGFSQSQSHSSIDDILESPTGSKLQCDVDVDSTSYLLDIVEDSYDGDTQALREQVRRSHVCAVVFDVTDDQSVARIPFWIDSLRAAVDNATGDSALMTDANASVYSSSADIRKTRSDSLNTSGNLIDESFAFNSYLRLNESTSFGLEPIAKPINTPPRNKRKALPIVLIGNKVDRDQDRCVSAQYIEQYARQNALHGYIETSSVDSFHCSELFDVLPQLALKYVSRSGGDVKEAAAVCVKPLLTNSSCRRLRSPRLQSCFSRKTAPAKVEKTLTVNVEESGGDIETIDAVNSVPFGSHSASISDSIDIPALVLCSRSTPETDTLQNNDQQSQRKDGCASEQVAAESTTQHSSVDVSTCANSERLSDDLLYCNTSDSAAQSVKRLRTDTEKTASSSDKAVSPRLDEGIAGVVRASADCNCTIC